MHCFVKIRQPVGRYCCNEHVPWPWSVLDLKTVWLWQELCYLCIHKLTEI